MTRFNLKNLPLVFRVDANNHIGAGHIMRCIALAQEWKKGGGNVVFLSCCESHIIRDRIVDEGFKYIDSATLSEQDDTQNTILILNGLSQAFWLVIDGYHFSDSYFQSIREAGYQVFLFDDVNHRNTVSVDIILNQNIDAEKMKYNCSSDTKILLGVKYALLRKDFFDYRGRQRIFPEKGNKIVVTMGGGDSENVTLEILKSLNLINDPELDVIIIVGPSNIHMDSLIKELSSSLFKNELRISVKNMPEIMAWADLAITAGGSTCWELCFMGVPSLVVCTAENQKHVINGLNRRQIFKTLGWWKDLDIENISLEIQELITDRQQRFRMTNLGKKLIDGKGSERLVNILLKNFKGYRQLRIQ